MEDSGNGDCQLLVIYLLIICLQIVYNYGKNVVNNLFTNCLQKIFILLIKLKNRLASVASEPMCGGRYCDVVEAVKKAVNRFASMGAGGFWEKIFFDVIKWFGLSTSLTKSLFNSTLRYFSLSHFFIPYHDPKPFSHLPPAPFPGKYNFKYLSTYFLFLLGFSPHIA